MTFDLIASTGRTATTYLATRLDRLDGIAATHEGYRGAKKEADPILPLVNLENAAAYASPKAAQEAVAALRGTESIATALAKSGAERLIDVAYYNAVIGEAVLTQHPQARMAGVIRDCASFVQSATTLTGEDPLPVGWPDPAKPLTDREKFISMGRIRPGRESRDNALWGSWGAIRRNIWLWQETNLRLCATQARFPERVTLMGFAALRQNPDGFWAHLSAFLELPPETKSTRTALGKMINKKPAGYQIGAPETWSAEDRAALATAETLIENAAHHAI